MYIRRPLAYRLRSVDTEVVYESSADLRDWVPGKRDVEDIVALPVNLDYGAYAIDVAILNLPGTAPEMPALPPIALAIDGRREDGWYEVSTIDIVID